MRDSRKCSIGSIRSRCESWWEAVTLVPGLLTPRGWKPEGLTGRGIQNNQVPCLLAQGLEWEGL